MADLSLLLDRLCFSRLKPIGSPLINLASVRNTLEHLGISVLVVVAVVVGVVVVVVVH